MIPPRCELPAKFMKLLSDKLGIRKGAWKCESQWAFADMIRMRSNWPAHTFMPMIFWEAFCWEAGISESKRSRLAAALQTIAAWRVGQDVIRFDEDMRQVFLESEFKGEMPVNLLNQFPAWSIYFDCKGLEADGNKWDGFFVTCDWWPPMPNPPRTYKDFDDFMEKRLADKNAGDKYLNIMFVCDNKEMSTSNLIIPVVDKTMAIENIVPLDVNDDRKIVDPLYKKVTGQIISMLIYVCSHGFEKHGGSLAINYPRAEKTKKGWRMYPPQKQNIHLLGEEIGLAIREWERKEYQGGKHASPKPHLRRGHIHSFWMGSKKEPEKRWLDFRWLPPMAVALKKELSHDKESCMETGTEKFCCPPKM